MADSELEDIEERLQQIDHRKAFGSAKVKLDLARALVSVRQATEITQQQLADAAGVSRAYIAKLESGRANPTIGQIGALLAAVWMKPELQPVALLAKGQGALARTNSSGPVPLAVAKGPIMARDRIRNRAQQTPASAPFGRGTRQH